MKVRFWAMLTGFLVLVLLVPFAGLSATYGQRCLFDIMIPFEFFVGDTPLPAGHYCVSHVLSPNVISIQHREGRANATILVRVSSSDPSEADSKLVFNKYGNRHFLSQVWTFSDRQIHQCAKSHAEQLEQLVTREDGRLEKVEIAMKR